MIQIITLNTPFFEKIEKMSLNYPHLNPGLAPGQDANEGNLGISFRSFYD